jgi:hypothetical protein
MAWRRRHAVGDGRAPVGVEELAFRTLCRPSEGNARAQARAPPNKSGRQDLNLRPLDPQPVFMGSAGKLEIPCFHGRYSTFEELANERIVDPFHAFFAQ